jgi:hypothetical protein
VDETSRWAPTDCRAPAPGPARISQSRDPETHGRKLYYLFARNRDAYLHASDLEQPPGQVIVKQSWHPAAGSTFVRPVTGLPGPLFVMAKTEGPEGDGGWIYATATPDGKTITAWGKLASCRECHEQAPQDRVFGLRTCGGAK